MRAVLFLSFLLTTTCTGVAPAFAADSSACYVIQDADARTYCLAKARHDVSQCYAIQRADLRAQCLAEIRK